MSVYDELATELGATVTEKNKAYGNSFSTAAKALEILYPDGIPVSKYGSILLFARMWDKHSREAHDADAFGESPYKDLAGYSLLGWAESEARKKAK